MIRNYLIIAWRNLLRNKVFSIINVFGLTIGIAACFLIMQYVRFEQSYDRFHKNHERIYRVLIDFGLANEPVLSAANHPGTAPAIGRNIFLRINPGWIISRICSLFLSDCKSS